MAESDEQTTGPEHDPFSPENAPMLNFIMQARIYDALIALLTTNDKELAKDLLEIHMGGGIMGPQPAFNGTFITDLANAENNTAESE